jgi:hypothetical protein
VIRPTQSRRVFAALLLGALAACASTSEGPSAPARFDGLYVSDEVAATPNYTSYIRFYPDGAVVMASVRDPSTPQEVATWLTPAHAFSATGRYDMSASGRLNLSVSRRALAADAPQVGAVASAYQGTIRSDVLRLDRGGEGEVQIVTYHFVPIDFAN